MKYKGTHQRISKEVLKEVNKHRMPSESFDSVLLRLFGIRRTPKPFFFKNKFKGGKI